MVGKMKITSAEFRKMALRFPGVIESAHMNHPDFRVEGKIFATLVYPDDGWGMVKLTPEQQSSFMRKAPDMFKPCNGVWGQRGATNVDLASARKKLLQAALETAHQNIASQVKNKRG